MTGPSPTEDDVASLSSSTAPPQTVQGLVEMAPDELLDLHEAEYLQQIEETAPVGHWTIDLDGGQMTWSHGLQRLLGTDGAEQWETADELRRIIHPEDREAFDAALREAIIRGEPFDLAHRINRPDGPALVARSTGRLYTDPKGRADRLLGITLLLDRPADEA